MGLDIQLFRDEATLKLVRESQRRRYKAPEEVDNVIEADENWRKSQLRSEQMKKLLNDCSRAIGDRKKKKEEDGVDLPLPEELLASVKEGKLDKEALAPLNVTQIKKVSKYFQDYISDLSNEAAEAEAKRDEFLSKIGNIIHESVPIAQDEDTGNKVERTFGVCVKASQHKLNHVDIMTKLNGMDCSKNVTGMAGGRAYVLRGCLVQLQLALVSYAMSFATSRGYIPFYPPFMMTKDAMADVAQLAQFDEELYKVSGEGDDKYLIATSEMPIAAYHRNKWFTELPEPIQYVGMSTCFRKEAGSHGRDTLGIFRVHQFDKLEQFIVASPRDGLSWDLLEKMINTSEAFCQSLDIPYRVVNICSAALNNAAAKKYDLEGYFPGGKTPTFRELVSCSNCTDYQSRSLGCRFGANNKNSNAPKEYTHMLNGTLCAVTRVMCCLCENHQTDDGIIIPTALRPFMMGKEMLRYDEAGKIPQY